MKTLALAPWPLLPAQSGGKERALHLFTALENQTTIICLDWTGNGKDTFIDRTKYVEIPAELRAQQRARAIFETIKLNTWDSIPNLCKNDLLKLQKAVDDADPDLVILEHPWLIDFIGERPFVYDAPNCETYYTGITYGQHSVDYQQVRDLERRAIEGAEHITYCSERDLEHMKQLWPGLEKTLTNNSTLIPNGTTITGKRTTGEKLNLIFIGSTYQPNIEAAQALADIAPLLPEYSIQLMGGCSDYVYTNAPNVDKLGHVTDKQLDYYLSNAHLFVNLVTKGSGTHLKIARAMSYGLPIVTTPVGGRGYTNIHETVKEYAAGKIRELRKDWQTHSDKAYEEALTLDWTISQQTFRQVIDALQ